MFKSLNRLFIMILYHLKYFRTNALLDMIIAFFLLFGFVESYWFVFFLSLTVKAFSGSTFLFRVT